MENLIYILIGIAWVAYSLYSARQKAIKKQQSPGLPAQGPSQSSPLPIPGNQGGGKMLFEDLLRELTGEPKHMPVYPEPEKYKVPDYRQSGLETIEPEISSKPFSYTSTSSPDFSTVSKKTTAQTIDFSEQTAKSIDFTKKFDLREAVIFSELLKPKYF